MNKMIIPFPSIHPPVFHTPSGIPYLQKPGVVVLAIPQVNMSGLRGFLVGFDQELNFVDYLADPTELPPAEQVSMIAGQLCYLSFGPKRTKRAEASKYFANIKESGHGSVLEHAQIVILGYGIDRSVSHEIVRHRAGFGFSQVSQRYTGPKTLRYVERLAYQDDTELHDDFIEDIEDNFARYERKAAKLLARQQAGNPKLAAESYTDRRKKVNQTARSVLSNDVEAPIVISANIRAWRHFIEMRASPHADVQARLFAYTVFECLVQIAPFMFEDYTTLSLDDGTKAVDTIYRKV